MGDSVEGLTAADLQQASRWLVRDATLKAANAQIVEYLHRLDFAAVWGDGHLSSSDGQRFRAPPGTLIGAYHPRYFGHYDKAVTVYTHVSQRIGVFSTQLMSCAPREATYVLDGLLDNDTSLDPRLHTTDTHGFTEPLWGLCHLLGIDFMPRIKDLADQRLWLPDGATSPDALSDLFAGTIDTVLISEQWDSLVRIAASLKARTAPAHVVLQRLTAGGPSDRIAKALAALGRLIKTRNILRYLHDVPLRRTIQAQLNRGESRHALACWLFFANQGEFRTSDYEAMMNKATCLDLLSNAMVLEAVRAGAAFDPVTARFHVPPGLDPAAREHLIQRWGGPRQEAPPAPAADRETMAAARAEPVEVFRRRVDAEQQRRRYRGAEQAGHPSRVGEAVTQILADVAKDAGAVVMTLADHRRQPAQRSASIEERRTAERDPAAVAAVSRRDPALQPLEVPPDLNHDRGRAQLRESLARLSPQLLQELYRVTDAAAQREGSSARDIRRSAALTAGRTLLLEEGRRRGIALADPAANRQRRAAQSVER